MNDQTLVDADIAEDEDFETIGDYHRIAAHHFTAAAKHHLAAADADDEGDEAGNARHALLAYRHQLNGVQAAEIANMESDTLEDEFDTPEEAV
jgi:rubrerythrin